MSLTKIWIDCAGSVDDMLALIILLDAPDYDVIAISSVRGKANSDQGIKNIARVLEVCNRSDIPLFSGALEPLITPFPKLDARFTVCEDSADAAFLTPKKSDGLVLPVSNQHASIHLVEAARDMEREIILVSLGPLTNVAVACLLDPLFPLRVGKFVAVGGSEVGGDVTLTAEFNFFVDPEAAEVVMHKLPLIYLVTRDLGQKYVWNMEEEWLEKAETPKARLLEDLLKIHGETGKIEWIGSTAIAAAIVGNPGLVSITKSAKCQIERIGTTTRGQSVFDFGPFDQDSKTSPNVALITEIDMVEFHRVLRNVIV